MNYTDFCTNLKEFLMREFSYLNLSFETQTVYKNNEELDGIVIHSEDFSLSPIIYPQKYYSQCGIISVEQIFSEISSTVSEAIKNQPSIPVFDEKNAREAIYFSLLNREKNLKVIEKCPYKEFHDLAAIPRWRIDDSTSVLVSYRMIEELHMSPLDILKIADENTRNDKYICVPIEKILENELSGFSDNHGPVTTGLYVLSKPAWSDGSSVLLSSEFIKKVAEYLNSSSLYLIPSSRHEILAASTDSITDIKFILKTVKEVNSTAVSSEDFLSNSVFYYDCVSESISAYSGTGYSANHIN